MSNRIETYGHDLPSQCHNYTPPEVRSVERSEEFLRAFNQLVANGYGFKFSSLFFSSNDSSDPVLRNIANYFYDRRDMFSAIDLGVEIYADRTRIMGGAPPDPLDHLNRLYWQKKEVPASISKEHDEQKLSPISVHTSRNETCGTVSFVILTGWAKEG